MEIADARAKARLLYAARRDRAPIPPFTDSEPWLDMADGYAVQHELVEILLGEGDRLIGYKVGATSQAMQDLIGLDSPDYGPVLASTVYHNGDVIGLDRFIAPKIEAEIGLVLGRRLAGPEVSADQARASISHAIAALEIVDSRIADWRIRLADTVADLASNGAIVMSSRLVPATGLDFRTIAMTLTCDGRVIGEGTGAEALGDPVTVLTWLANVLGSSGVTLEAGHVIMTGALHAAVPISPGETYRAEFDLLGSLTVSSAAVTV